MGNNAVPIVAWVICIALLFGYISSLASTPEITLKSTLDDYNGAFTPGESITNAPTGEGSEVGSMVGFVLDIPIIGDILSFLTWIITQIISMVVNVAILPEIFPTWMGPIFAVGFLFFIVYVYLMLMPGKT